MGAERDSLISQALFMFARLNGYLAPGAASPPSPRLVAPGVAPSAVTPRLTEPESPAAPLASLPARSRGDADSAARRSSVTRPPEPPVEDPVRREVAERVLETAAELERLMKDKNQSEPGRAGARDDHAKESGEKELYLMGEDGALDKVIKERFVIGRGKHCDLVINSGKVSREHAAIIREGNEHFVEDLGSSNGTWYNKQRIRRRKVEDGDEYFICSEKVKCVIR